MNMSMSMVAARSCDSCRASAALLFCHGHSAFLCSPCDSSIHANHHHLQQRHERVWLCDVCEQAPAAFTCKADAATLCLTCDADIHSANPLSRRHDRSPVVPFYHSPLAKPPVTANFLDPTHDHNEEEEEEEEEEEVEKAEGPTGGAASFWLFNKGGVAPEMGAPAVKGHGQLAPDMPLFFTSADQEVDPYLNLDYASPVGIDLNNNCSFHHHQNESVVPVQSHNHHQYAQAAQPFFAAPAAGSYSVSHSVSSSEVGVVPDGSAVADVTNPYGSGGQAGPVVAVGMDREARVMRYREKRKTRRFEKTIRYASRKAYAETRPRIKGRFAKRSETEAEPDVAAGIFYHRGPGGGGIMVDSGYGVVPSF